MKKYIQTAINIIFFILIMTGCIFFINTGKIYVKGLASFSFMMLGLFNLIYFVRIKSKPVLFAAFIFCGLFLALIADVTICYNFIFGAVIFAIGHIYYYLSQCFISKIRAVDLLFTASFFVLAISILLFFPGLNLESINVKFVCIFYSFIISFMAGKAVSNAFELKNLYSILFTIGCILFYFSDVCLVIDLFSDVWDLAGMVCLLTYYPAQFILGFSVYNLTRYTSKKIKA